MLFYFAWTPPFFFTTFYIFNPIISLLVSRRCIPSETEGILNVIDQSELIQAIQNLELLSTVHGVSGLSNIYYTQDYQ